MCTFRRHTYFTHPPYARHVSTQLRTAEPLGFAVLAYVVMPDHLHFVAHGESDDADFLRLAARFRRRTAADFRMKVPWDLWQGGYHEHVLRREEDVASTIAYVLENPCRAGLVTHAHDYPFSWSVAGADAAFAPTPRYDSTNRRLP